MGGGASKCMDPNKKEIQAEEAQKEALPNTLVVSNYFFKKRPSMDELERSFSYRLRVSSEGRFNLAALELLSTLLQKKTATEKEKFMLFEQWLDEKSLLCGIEIKKSHVNVVSTSIAHQQALPEGCLNLLDVYLENLPSDFDMIARINTVSDEHAHDLTKSAEEHHFVHHDLPHALEIELRTMNMLKKLNMWQTQNSRDVFFRAIIACIIRLHDHEQKNKISGVSNEEITAERVITWLNAALDLPDEANATAEEKAVRHIIEFMAYRIISCGTTMIYSEKRTLDLIELLFFLEKLAKDVAFSLSSKFNQNFVDMINITTILAGANDKNPGASLLNVLEQLKQPSMTTLSLIQDYYGHTSMLNTFFLSPKFKAYYDLDRLREHYDTEGFREYYCNERDFFEAVNKQAFLMMVVPHICMGPEFLSATDTHRIKLRAFIQACRANLGLDAEAFKAEFEAMFVENGMAEIMHAVFFEKIDSEAGFSRSQEGGLNEMAQTNLPGMGLKRANVVYSLIDPSVPEKDAVHLNELKAFYDVLAPHDKIILCKELMMTVILQAGAMKAYELGLVNLNVKPPILSI